MTHWRVHLFWLIVVSCLVFVGCDSGYVQKQSSIISEKTKSVKDLADELVETVNRFDDENWRDVVPEVRRLADELSSGAEEAAEAAQELEEAVTSDEERDS